MKYTVSAVSASSPEMGAQEFAEFVASIKEHGQLEPIWVRGNEVIDGRKRLRACEQLGIEPKVVDTDPSLDPKALAYALNILRTQYTHAQRSAFGADRVNATPADGARLRSDRCPGKFAGARVITTAQAAREVGVSERLVREAKRIKREAAPEVFEAVKAGKLTLHAASQVAQLPKPRQPTAVQKVVEAGRGGARRTPVAAALTAPRRRRSRGRSPAEQIAVLGEQASMAVRALEMVLAGARDTQVSAACLALLRKTRGQLAAAIHRLEANREEGR